MGDEEYVSSYLPSMKRSRCRCPSKSQSHLVEHCASDILEEVAIQRHLTVDAKALKEPRTYQEGLRRKHGQQPNVEKETKRNSHFVVCRQYSKAQSRKEV